jgi:hypothetical protein
VPVGEPERAVRRDALRQERVPVDVEDLAGGSRSAELAAVLVERVDQVRAVVDEECPVGRNAGEELAVAREERPRDRHEPLAHDDHQRAEHDRHVSLGRQRLLAAVAR